MFMIFLAYLESICTDIMELKRFYESDGVSNISTTYKKVDNLHSSTSTFSIHYEIISIKN